MKNLQELKETLTSLEFEMLNKIVKSYDMRNNICYDYKLTPKEKGIVGNLVKKGLVYDSFIDMHDEDGYENSNWFPSDLVLDINGLPHF
jgi:hypothetical protein